MENEILTPIAAETMNDEPRSGNKKPMTRTQKRNLFFGLMVAVPILIFIIFYVIVNFNSITLAFKKYEEIEGQVGYTVSFAWLDNFAIIFKMLADGENWKMVTNSIFLWACKMCIGIPFAILFSYYVYKKRLASGFFRVILFLPNVVSNIIMVSMFSFLVDMVLPQVFGWEKGLIENSPDTAFYTIMFYHIWLGFASHTLLFTSSMSGINESIVESAQLDGASSMQELWYITLPMIFPTITTFIIVGLAEMFTDQMSLVVFYEKFSTPAEFRTIGYYLFWQSYESPGLAGAGWVPNNFYAKLTYPQLSAFGLMISLIVIPLSMGTKKLLEKLGPSVD